MPRLKPRDVVVLDNLSSHKSTAVRKVVWAAGARLFFLPLYSLDLNPIELVFAKLSHLIRKAAERAVESTWKRSGQLLDGFTSDDRSRYLINSGHASSKIRSA